MLSGKSETKEVILITNFNHPIVGAIKMGQNMKHFK